ncbi:MAG TPA: O-antigen polymerase [Pyrinomonadaceae bacterium]|nr:O-antigen polymerase [Pyrinomonadaceae bacterium]
MFETLYQDIPTALFVDLVVLAVCSIALLRYGRLAHSHPAMTYLVFHALVVPLRLFAVWAGAETLFAEWYFFEAVTEAELARAAILFDLTLIIMTIAWIRASAVDAKKQRAQVKNPKEGVLLSLPHIWAVVLIALPIGIAGLLLMGKIPGLERPEMDLGAWEESSWLVITMTWSGLAIVALIYWYGLRWWLLAPTCVYLTIIALQGYSRFRFVIPLILLAQIYLDRRGKRWPTPMVLAVMAGVFVIFFPLKQIGRMTQTGASLTEIRTTSSEIIDEAMAGKHGDQELLDQFASSLTLIDRAGKFYYGSPYLVLATSPIPRQWWAEKPGLADFMREFSTPGRPMFEMGMVMSFVGDFYLNFGYIGIIVLSYLFAYTLARIYFRAYRANYFSVLRFAYLLVACNLIQIYRDGLMSIIIFTCVNMMPLAAIVALHYIGGRRRVRPYIRLPYYQNLKPTNQVE